MVAARPCSMLERDGRPEHVAARKSVGRVKLGGHMHDYAVAARRPHGIMEVEGEFGAAKGRHK